MSLFKLKSLFTKVFSDEEFDQKHLAVGFIDSDRKPVIALASFQGILRLFLITREKEIALRSIYQNKFQTSIISVEFVSHPDETIRHSTLGVLLFRKFAFISFELTAGSYEAKILTIDVEPSFGICISPLSVMTLNSSIQALNPREVHKIKVADPIYPFASQLSKLYFMDGQELVEIEGATEQWRIILGRIRQLFVLGETVIAVGEWALWEISNAKIVKTKVMDEEISCGAIAFRNSILFNIVIANFSSQLLVYSPNYELLWAIRLDYVPIKVIVCQHENIKGMLVLLSDEGSLELAYSGVDMPQSVVEPLSEKIDYAIVQAQTQEFLRKMKDKGIAKKSEDRVSLEGGYRLYFGQLQKTYEGHQQKQQLFQIEGKLVRFQFICQITSRENLRNFKIQLNIPYNLNCKDQIKDLNVAKNKDKIVFHLYASNERFPYQKQLTVMIRYQNNEQKGAPFIKSESVPIPMGLQCLVSGYETKDNFPNKIIVKSNIELPSFNDIFPDLFPKGSQEQRKSIKFTLANGVECTISYNKGLNKAKIESQYYSGLCYIVSQFSNNVRKYSSKGSSKIDLSVEIPLQQFFGIMKQHYEHRLTVKNAFKDVQLKSEEFRSTQKKLLVKMKEKMTNLGSVDKLLQYTYERLLESATKYEETTQQMDIINHNLCVAIKLIIELLFIRSNPSEKARNIAVGILGYEKECLQRGWEDKVLANSSHFLNKKYKKGDQISFEQLQKIPLYVISKVNNGDWS